MKVKNYELIYDYRILRLITGILAFALPIVVILAAGEDLQSISDGYCSKARDYLVGMLFMVGLLLFVYKGYSKWEWSLNKFASVCAFLVALVPSCVDIPYRWIHYIAAFVLFVQLALICGIFFPRKAPSESIKWMLRIIALLMALCLILIPLAAKFAFFPQSTLVFEFLVLWLFGMGWVVASETLPWFKGKK